MANALPYGPHLGAEPQRAPRQCRNSDTCCRWSLFTSWAAQFHARKQIPPAYSFSSSRIPIHNKVDRIYFYCADRRIHRLPKGESAVRGPYVIHCAKDDVVQTWPTSGPIHAGTNFRSACVRTDINTNTYRLYDIAPDAKSCYAMDVAERGNVLTVYTYQRDDETQLMNTYLSITEYPPHMNVSQQPPEKFIYMGSSYSAMVDSGKIYSVCILNTANNGQLGQKDLYANIVVSDSDPRRTS